MKRSRILLFAVLPLATIAIILMTVAYSLAYDPQGSNYFPGNNPLPSLAVVAAALAVAVGIVGIILPKKYSEPLKMRSEPFYAPIPSAIGSLVSAILLFVAKEPIVGLLFLLTAVFFALTACPFAKRYASAILWAGFASVAATVMLNAVYYFDMTVEMNAPIKVLLQMGLLAAMLDCTVEMRLLIDRADGILPSILTAFAVTVCGLSSVPTLVAQIGGKLPDLSYFASVPFLFGIFFTALIRFSRLIFAIPQKQNVIEDPTAEGKEN